MNDGIEATKSDIELAANSVGDGFQDRSPRKKIMLPGKVSACKGKRSYKCIITDASKSGCQFTSSSINDLHDDIMITVGELSEPMRGKIVWRRKGAAGVKFQWLKPVPGDRRNDHRFEINLPAVISGLHEALSIDCIVQNISETGCLVACPEVLSLPEMICLKLRGLDYELEGRIIHRDVNIAGVTFTKLSHSDSAP